jgi:hypothetical protein
MIKELKKLKSIWDRGPFLKFALVFAVAGPITVACAFLAPILLLADVITPQMYQYLGQKFIYMGISFMPIAALMVLLARINGEFEV